MIDFNIYLTELIHDLNKLSIEIVSFNQLKWFRTARLTNIDLKVSLTE